MATIVNPLNGSQGIAFPRQTLQAGPGKGVGVTIPVDNYTDITFFIEYTRAAVGGGVQFNVEASNDKLNWYMVCETQSPAIVPGCCAPRAKALCPAAAGTRPGHRRADDSRPARPALPRRH